MDRDLIRATAPPLLAACVIALILGRIDDDVPPPPVPAPAAELPSESAQP